MRLGALVLENFRSFAGRNRIELSTDEHQRVTVIHGENGSGKTTILNAFKWAFYGHTDFDTGDEHIINEHAVNSAEPGASVTLRVQVEFEHEGLPYSMTREQTFISKEGGDAEAVGGSIPTLEWTDSNGEHHKSSNPENQINQILPERMHSYFFFNGERIEKLANVGSSQHIRSAIKTLMGLEIVERACDHLEQDVRKVFQDDLKKQSGGKLDKVIDEEDRLRAALADTIAKIEACDENVNSCQDEIQAIDERLSTIREAQELQKERDAIKERLKALRKELGDLSRDVRGEISKSGFLAFLDDAAESAAGILEERRRKGELPVKVKRQFVEDLLEQARCICGRELSQGSGPYREVRSVLSTSAGKGVEEAFIETSGDLKRFPEARKELFRDLRRLQQRKGDLEEERDGLNGRLDDISDKLQGHEVEELAGLERNRKEKEDLRVHNLIQRDRLNRKREELKEELKKVKAKREKLASTQERARKAREKLHLTEELAQVARELHEALANKTRAQLSEKVNTTFRNILAKDYWAEIGDDYTLQVFKNSPGGGKRQVIEKSTGEKQIVSMCFIASIVSLAKESHRRQKAYFKGGIFPIVMDSPYGQLDNMYKRMVARFIPQLADQIVLMATSSQWKGPVEEECGPRVGKHISLIYHAPSVAKESDYVRQDSDYEYTEVEEGYYG